MREIAKYLSSKHNSWVKKFTFQNILFRIESYDQFQIYRYEKLRKFSILYEKGGKKLWLTYFCNRNDFVEISLLEIKWLIQYNLKT